jgi:hypothetical protein
MIETYTFLSYFVIFSMAVAIIGLISIVVYCSEELAKGTGCDPTLPGCEIEVFKTS